MNRRNVNGVGNEVDVSRHSVYAQAVDPATERLFAGRRVTDVGPLHYQQAGRCPPFSDFIGSRWKCHDCLLALGFVCQKECHIFFDLQKI